MHDPNNTSSPPLADTPIDMTSTTTSITCRVYRPSDYLAVRRLFANGICGGNTGSVYYAALNTVGRNVSRRCHLAALVISLVGICFLRHLQTSFVWEGLPFFIASFCVLLLVVTFILFPQFYALLINKDFRQYVEQVFLQDLHPETLPQWYGIKALTHQQVRSEESPDKLQEDQEVWEAPGISGFWVAVLRTSTSSLSDSRNKVLHIREEIVGCVGLDESRDDKANSQSNDIILTIRRLSVSHAHRSKGIGKLLVHHLLDHARSRLLSQSPSSSSTSGLPSPPSELKGSRHRNAIVTLITSEFQLAAQHLYERKFQFQRHPVDDHVMRVFGLPRIGWGAYDAQIFGYRLLLTVAAPRDDSS